MRSHVLRPPLAIAFLVLAVLLTRAVLVPRDFAVGERGYMYDWHRQGNEAEWKAMPAAYQPVSVCRDCHSAEVVALSQSPHAGINCQDCHGPARSHPDVPPALSINRSPALCLRCHARLPYPNSPRGALAGVNAAEHHPGAPCAECHNPHKPNVEDLVS
jgi:predicted CXXCH cytochrome family protein